MPTNQSTKLGACCAIGGSVLLFTGSFFHPSGANPADPVAAFTEYAANDLWITSHLIQLAGIALIVAALLLLAQRLEQGRGAAWAHIASGGAIASLAIAAAVQAVDGIALKTMVDNWVSAPAADKDLAFQAAFAVRQIEIGLASALALILGVTIVLYGLAMHASRAFSVWIGVIAIIGGAATAGGGLAIAYTGFSSLAMLIGMPAHILMLVWMFTVGVCMWRGLD